VALARQGGGQQEAEDEAGATTASLLHGCWSPYGLLCSHGPHTVTRALIVA
jgi:hypothetical protein